MHEAPSEDELVDAVEDAAGRAAMELFEKTQESFYYVSLITSGEACAPCLVAWSHEALQRVTRGSARLTYELKWSYADSPYFDWGHEYFEGVRRLFGLRPQLDFAAPVQWDLEHELRLRAMEKAMLRLDRRGLFGSGEQRQSVVINVEVMPPDYTNTERALRLNPRGALPEWLETVAEERHVNGP